MLRFHRDLQEMAVTESLPLRQTPCDPNHLRATL